MAHRTARAVLARAALTDAGTAYRRGWRTALSAGLLTFSETAPLSALGVATSPAAIGFAPFDRVLKYGYIGVYMITGSFQGWVASANGEAGLRRMRRAVGIHAALALGLGAAFALIVPGPPRSRSAQASSSAPPPHSSAASLSPR